MTNLAKFSWMPQDLSSVPSPDSRYQTRFQRKAKNLIDSARAGKYLDRTERRIVRHYTDQQRRQLALKSLKTETEAA